MAETYVSIEGFLCEVITSSNNEKLSRNAFEMGESLEEAHRKAWYALSLRERFFLNKRNGIRMYVKLRLKDTRKCAILRNNFK